MSIPVILADDHALIRSGVEGLLAGSGFEVVASVATGAAALSAIAEHDPAIAILDLRMPEGTGIEVLDAMRARGDTRPVVLLTADLGDRKLLAALDAGVEGIVMKEGGENHLVACLHAVHRGERHIPAELLARARRIREKMAETPFKHLSPRETEMAWMVGQGMRNREIADRFGLSEGAVKFALHAVFRKLKVTTRTELALMLQRHGSDGAG